MDIILLVLTYLLTPNQVVIPKIRVGNRHDGGYVMLDLYLDKIAGVYSYGISNDVSFDLDLTTRCNKPIYMYDHTITGLPQQHPNFVWRREGVGATSGININSLRKHLIDNEGLGKHNILKMDVEGAEFAAFSTADAEVMNSWDQIIIEVHNLESQAEQVVRLLVTILRTHRLIHVHGNNHAHVFTTLEGAKIPNVIELTFVHSSLVQIGPNTQLYPTLLDSPNAHWAPDINLHTYPFLPQVR